MSGIIIICMRLRNSVPTGAMNVRATSTEPEVWRMSPRRRAEHGRDEHLHGKIHFHYCMSPLKMLKRILDTEATACILSKVSSGEAKRPARTHREFFEKLLAAERRGRACVRGQTVSPFSYVPCPVSIFRTQGLGPLRSRDICRSLSSRRAPCNRAAPGFRMFSRAKAPKS